MKIRLSGLLSWISAPVGFEVINCRMSPEFSPFRQVTIFTMQLFPLRYSRVCGGRTDPLSGLWHDLYQDLSPLFERVDPKGYGLGAMVDKPTTTDGFNAGLLVIDELGGKSASNREELFWPHSWTPSCIRGQGNFESVFQKRCVVVSITLDL